MVLTTDHGTSSVPEYLVSRGEHAARIDTLGHLLPAIFKYVGAMEVAQVNLPVAVLTFFGMPTRHVTYVEKLRMQVARST